jgi:hypothetical protein
MKITSFLFNINAYGEGLGQTKNGREVYGSVIKEYPRSQHRRLSFDWWLLLSFTVVVCVVVRDIICMYL